MLVEGRGVRGREGQEGEGHARQRLIASATCVEPEFRAILFPYKAGQPLPTTKWSRDRTVLTVTFDGRTDVLEFTTTEKEGTRIRFAK